MSQRVAEISWEKMFTQMTLLPTHAIKLLGLKDNRN